MRIGSDSAVLTIFFGEGVPQESILPSRPRQPAIVNGETRRPCIHSTSTADPPALILPLYASAK